MWFRYNTIDFLQNSHPVPRTFHIFSRYQNDTVWCRCNTSDFLQNSHPVTCPWGRGMGCLLWVPSMICVLHALVMRQHADPSLVQLTHWGRVTHICVSKLIIIGSDNGLSPERRQAIIWTIAGILLIETLGTNFSQISSEIHTFSFKKMHLKMSSGKCRPSCLGLNVLMVWRLFSAETLFEPMLDFC